MADEEWNEEQRSEMLESLRGYILGELRLAKHDDDTILDLVVDRLVDEVPEDELPRFEAHAQEQLAAVRAEFFAEQATWPEETDCDRLDDAQLELQKRGILLWQASPCCDTCSGAELPERIEAVDETEPGFADRCRGYAFFHDQSLSDELLDGTQLSVYLSYGWFAPTDKVSKEEYQQRALAIGEEVREVLESAGFRVVWDGRLSKKINLSLNWQRRSLLS